jgi:hypothetical protein
MFMQVLSMSEKEVETLSEKRFSELSPLVEHHYKQQFKGL